ncbi:MAG: peptide deformylase [Planctomycetes bacterium]|nr:peptide deformylase [Planctomycetota bacterium]
MELVLYPDPILSRPSEPIARRGASARRRVSQMLEIMYEAGGVGLAAPQAGWSARLFVLNLTGQPEDERVYINPRIVSMAGEEDGEEGCLSFPDIRADILRAQRVTIEASDLDGKVFRESREGFGARAFQHEIDHLDGVLFIARMREEDRIRVQPQLRELEERYRGRTRRRKPVPKKAGG